MKKKIKIIDLFAGVGGLSYAFANDANFEIIAANEILPSMAKAYELNHPKVKVYCKDILNFGFSDLKNDFNLTRGSIDIVVGGPPCQAYSTVGKRLIDDPRGKLFQEYYRILKELDPSIFIFENVKGLISMGEGYLLPTIIELFTTLGYTTQYKILNAADFGAPQIRERIIIVGTKRGIKYKYPIETHGISADLFNEKTRPYLTLKEALSDLPLNPSESNFYATAPQNEFQQLMRVNASEMVSEHSVPKNNPSLIKIMEMLPEGGTPKDLPMEIRPSSGFGNSYSRLWWNRPSTTITRNFSTPSSARCIHPLAARPLSTREGARIQGFPDNYLFYGSRSEKNLQIGNAVSPFLSRALMTSLKKCLL